MNFRNAAPTADGFYWLRRQDKRDTIVKVYDIADGLEEYGAMVAFVGSDHDMSLARALRTWQCLWGGPLTHLPTALDSAY